MDRLLFIHERYSMDTNTLANAVERAIAEEQVFVDRAYSLLDQRMNDYTERLRAVRAQKGQESAGELSERDSFAAHYEDAIMRLRGVENRLVVGRIDTDKGQTHHIGRIGLTDTHQNPVLLDWRAPGASAFYRATPAHRHGVVLRRHIATRLRKVTGVEDELLDASAPTSELNLTGEGALMAALRQSRTGKMSDIVATIQKEQDVIIRSDAQGVMVIQGGPGTGKTAVALHRAAYLLYTQRERLARSGILVVGPSDLFIRYIDHVLPSLGESDVVSTTLESLLPEVTVTRKESAEVEEIKGRRLWKDICKRAIDILERPLEKDIRIRCGADWLLLTPDDVHAAQAEARLASHYHNVARDTYARYLVNLLARQVAQSSGTTLEESPWIIRDIASSVEVRREVNLHWLPSSAPALLERIFSRCDILESIAPELTEYERELLYRPKGSGFSRGDIALLDELSELLGTYISPSEQVRLAQKKAERDEVNAYISRTFRSTGLGRGIVSAERYMYDDSSSPTSSLAERAARDRQWTYGHIIVDEAQELSPMEWEMLRRRCPSQSMTIVGDLDQRRQGAPKEGWAQLLGSLEKKAHYCNLSISYRTPGEILRAASRVMEHAGWHTHTVVPAREEENCLHIEHVDNLVSALLTASSAEMDFLDKNCGHGHGLIAIIAPEKYCDEIAQACHKAQLDCVRGIHSAREKARIHILSAREAKGLEYDSVILAEPSEILDEGAGNLYVAITRATRRLLCFYTHKLPEGFTQ